MKGIAIVSSDKLAPSVGPFSAALKANGFLFLSGQVGIDKDGNLAGGFEEEFHQVMKNIGFLLSAEGLGYGDLVTVTIYLKDMKNFSRLNEGYKGYFEGAYPTRTCIAVADLPIGANVEMTVTALLKN